MRRSLSIAWLLCLGCSGRAAPLPTATTWPEADALFRSDPRWMGADGAYSIDLGGDRTLWLFGDTNLARELADPHHSTAFIRNSVAIQTGRDPSHALIEFAWQQDTDGAPHSFLAEDGGDWFWPEHGVRLDDKLLIFWQRVQTPTGDPTGFAGAGWRAIVVDDPDDSPLVWSMHDATSPANDLGITLGGAVAIVGTNVYVYGSRGVTHDVLLARFDRHAAHDGDLSDPEWWSGDAGWVRGANANPVVIAGTNAPEFSVHHDPIVNQWVMVMSEGYGATTLALRVADNPEGPWTDPRSFLRPPESFDDDAFGYAGKAHPELTGADLVVTYVPSRFVDRPDAADTLYHPHFVRLTWP
ncbi:MAG: DUF4185 domain-containing protein [Polyangiales bacterium]